VHSHARDDDEDIFGTERFQSLTKLVVLMWIFGFKERDLDQWNIKGVGFFVEYC
jgi:hypothetical protein